MQFYFIRHGQSENNALWDLTGSNRGRSHDPELTELGRQQAHLLANFLRQSGSTPENIDDPKNVGGFHITHLYTSLMIRAAATAQIVAETLDIPVMAWEDLHEEGGIYLEDELTGECKGLAGANREYFRAHYPSLILPESLWEAGWWNRPYEEPDQRPQRARRFWQGLIERHSETDDRVAVISHGGFYNHLLAVVLNLPKRDGYWFAINNAAITRIDLQGREIGLVYQNRVDFLPREWIT